MNIDLLTPGEEYQVAIKFLEYADSKMEMGFPMSRKIAKEIVFGKYWEANDCGHTERQEYWRVVLNILDGMTSDNIKQEPKEQDDNYDGPGDEYYERLEGGIKTTGEDMDRYKKLK